MKVAKNVAWVDRHAAFTQTDLYKNFSDSLYLEREEILMAGKRTRDPHALSKLEGFDQAASFFQRCADATRIQKDINEDLNEPD